MCVSSPGKNLNLAKQLLRKSQSLEWMLFLLLFFFSGFFSLVFRRNPSVLRLNYIKKIFDFFFSYTNIFKKNLKEVCDNNNNNNDDYDEYIIEIWETYDDVRLRTSWRAYFIDKHQQQQQKVCRRERDWWNQANVGTTRL